MLEMKIIDWFQLHRTGAMDAVMSVVSFLSEGVVVIVAAGIVAGYFLYLRRRQDAFILFGGTGGGAVLELILKHMFGRPRPPLEHQIPGFSFPSGHALCSTVFIGLLAILVGRMQPGRRALYYSLAVVALLAVGLDRVYLGVHWPSDVLAGYVMGVIIIAIWPALVQRVWPPSVPARPVPEKT